MIKKFLLLATAAMVSASCAFAQDDGGGRMGGRRGGGMRGQRGFGGQRGGMRMQFRDVRGEAEKQIAAKFGKEYAALAKERAENEAKLQALAKKANVTLPQADFVRREKMAEFNKKYEKELKEIAELQKTDFRAAMRKRMELMKKAGIEMPFGGRMGGMRGQRGPGGPGADGAPAFRRGNPRAQMEKMMKEKLPADYAEYEKLKKTDPRKSQMKFREMAKKLRKMNKPGAPAAAK